MKEPLEQLESYYASIAELRSERMTPEPARKSAWGWLMPITVAALAYCALALSSTGAASPGHLPRDVIERQIAGTGLSHPPVSGTSSLGRREA